MWERKEGYPELPPQLKNKPLWVWQHHVKVCRDQPLQWQWGLRTVNIWEIREKGRATACFLIAKNSCRREETQTDLTCFSYETEDDFSELDFRSARFPLVCLTFTSVTITAVYSLWRWSANWTSHFCSCFYSSSLLELCVLQKIIIITRDFICFQLVLTFHDSRRWLKVSSCWRINLKKWRLSFDLNL